MNKHKKSKHLLGSVCLTEGIPTARRCRKTGKRYEYGLRLSIHKLDGLSPENSLPILYLAQCEYGGTIYAEFRAMDDSPDIKRFLLRARHHFQKVAQRPRWEKAHHSEQGR